MSRGRGLVNISTYVDVDVDEADLEDAGYHHDDDCPAKTGGCGHPDRDAVDVALDDLHRQAGHGDYPVYVCTAEPCRSLYLVPRGDQAQAGRRVAA